VLRASHCCPRCSGCRSIRPQCVCRRKRHATVHGQIHSLSLTVIGPVNPFKTVRAILSGPGQHHSEPTAEGACLLCPSGVTTRERIAVIEQSCADFIGCGGCDARFRDGAKRCRPSPFRQRVRASANRRSKSARFGLRNVITIAPLWRLNANGMV